MFNASKIHGADNPRLALPGCKLALSRVGPMDGAYH